MNRLRVVFDTNVLVSAALVSDSLPRRALDKCLDTGSVLVSVPLLLEVADVLNRDKFDKYLTADERMRFLVGFLKVSELVEITETITLARDAADNKLLELAVSGAADCLITGDDDLLSLHLFQNVKILTPRDFLVEDS